MAIDRQYNVRVNIVADNTGAKQAKDALDDLEKHGAGNLSGVREESEKLTGSLHEGHAAARLLGSQLGELGHIAHYALDGPLAGIAGAVFGVKALSEYMDSLAAKATEAGKAIAETLQKVKDGADEAADSLAKMKLDESFSKANDEVGEMATKLGLVVDESKEVAKVLGVGELSQTMVERALTGKALEGVSEARTAAAVEADAARARAEALAGSNTPATLTAQADNEAKAAEAAQAKIDAIQQRLDTGGIYRTDAQRAGAQQEIDRLQEEKERHEKGVTEAKDQLARFNLDKDSSAKESARTSSVLEKLNAQFEELSVKLDRLNTKSEIQGAGEHLDTGLGQIFRGGDKGAISATLGGLGMDAAQIDRFERAIAGAAADPVLMGRILTVAERMAQNNALHNSEITSRLSRLEARVDGNHATRNMPGT